MFKRSKIIILTGALMLLAGLAWMVEPYYTWAQDDHPCRVSVDVEEPLFDLDNMNPGDTEEESVTVTKEGEDPAELYFFWQWVDGDPEVGEEGSLFEQLEMIVTGREPGDEEVELFNDSMGAWLDNGEIPDQDDAEDFAVNITEALNLDMLEQDDQVVLDFKITLPGPETGNEFQGSTVTTRLVFFTVCEEDDLPTIPPPLPPPPEEPPEEEEPEEEPDETVIVEVPEEPAVDPDPEPEPDPEPDPEPEPEEDVVVIPPEDPGVAPPLPRTDGASVTLIVLGLVLLITGVSLKRKTTA